MSTSAECEPIFRKRPARTTKRKRPLTSSQAISSDSEKFELDSADSEEEQFAKSKSAKLPKKAGLHVSQSANVRPSATDVSVTKFDAERSAGLHENNDATRQTSWSDDEPGNSGSNGVKHPELFNGPDFDGIYRGRNGYRSFIPKSANAPERQAGPIKAPTNIRAVTIMDFAPDVCKDYKQTGFCGFGDSCKFLHAREDYKQGWQLSRDWEIETKGRHPHGKTVASAAGQAKVPDSQPSMSAGSSDIPFACVICKKSYQSPIVTKCGHYFCEKCALDRYRKSPNCAICGANTGGMFNVAKGLRKALNSQK